MIEAEAFCGYFASFIRWGFLGLAVVGLLILVATIRDSLWLACRFQWRAAWPGLRQALVGGWWLMFVLGLAGWAGLTVVMRQYPVE